MKEKQLKIFAGVFLGLLIVYFISKPRHTGVDLDEFVQTIVIGVAKEDVKEIEVYKQTTEEEPVRMVFINQDEQWHVATKFNAKAQKDRMDKIIDEALEMTGNVRSSDIKHHEDFQITDELGLHLILKDEAQKPLANLIIGKRAEDYNSGFVRFTGREKVYSVDKNLLSTLNIYGAIDTLSRFKDDFFIDLQAVEKEKDDLDKVTVVSGNKKLEIQKVDKEVEVMNADSTMSTKIEQEWVLVRGSRQVDLDQKEVDKFFQDAGKIRAQEVVDRLGNTFADMNKVSKYGVRRPSQYISFKVAADQTDNVIFGKAYEKDKGYYMYVQYEGLMYKCAKHNYEKIFKWIDDLPEKTKQEK